MKGKLEESRKAIQRSIELSKTSSDPALRLPAEIQAARVEMTSSDLRAMNSARQDLRSTMATARRLGYYGIECEARLALGELDLKLNPGTGRAELASLAAETRNHDMEFLAHQAERPLAVGTSSPSTKPRNNFGNQDYCPMDNSCFAFTHLVLQVTSFCKLLT